MNIADFLNKGPRWSSPPGTANLGLIVALTRPREDVVFDEHAYASIRDGIRLAHARARSFRRTDAQSLLDVSAGSISGSLCIVGGLYSTHGDIAPPPELIAVAQQREIILIFDDARGLGTLGASGGVASEMHGSLPDIRRPLMSWPVT